MTGNISPMVGDRKKVRRGAALWIQPAVRSKKRGKPLGNGRAENILRQSGGWVFQKALFSSKKEGIKDQAFIQSLSDPIIAKQYLEKALFANKSEVMILLSKHGLVKFYLWLMVGGSRLKLEKNFDKKWGRCWILSKPADMLVKRPRSLPPRKMAMLLLGLTKDGRAATFPSEEAYERYLLKQKETTKR